MALELNPTRNVVTVDVLGQEVEFYTKVPTATQIRRYNSEVIGKRGLRTKRLFAARINAAKELVEGFREGDLMVNGEPLLQDTEGWKDVVEKACPQIFEAVGRLLLDSTSAESGSSDDDENDEDDEDKKAPLSASQPSTSA